MINRRQHQWLVVSPWDIVELCDIMLPRQPQHNKLNSYLHHPGSTKGCEPKPFLITSRLAEILFESSENC